MFMDFSRNFAGAVLCSMLAFSPALAGIDVSVDAKAGVLPISPYLYGRNIDKVNDGSAEAIRPSRNLLARCARRAST